MPEVTPSSSATSDLSVPWTRAGLLNTTTYIASSDFISHVAWVRSSNQSDLVLSSSAPNDSDSSSNRATCAVVGTVSPNRLYLEPHGNFNPNFENTALETSKAQFQLIAPSQPDFEADFNHGLKNIETVQRMACKEGPGAEHFVVSDGGKKALKFSWPLFEKRVLPYDPTDNEDWSNDYPVDERFRDAFEDLVPKWRVSPLPAFDASGKFIKTRDLENALRGSMVLVYFEMRHYAIKEKKGTSITSNTVSAIATQVSVVESGADRLPSPYKSQLLKGPKFLPQAASKRQDQLNAAKAFHPAGSTLSTSGRVDVSASQKKEGKKRKVDDDPEGTATEDESHDRTTKKKRTQTK